MSHRRPLVALALIAALGWLPVAGPARAQGARVAFVDTERIVRDSAVAKAYQQQLEKEFAARDQELQKKAQRLVSLRREFERLAATLGEADRRARAREIDALDRDVSRSNTTFQEDLSARRNELMTELSRRTDTAVNRVMQDEKYDVVLQFVLYWSPRIDITDKVLRLLASEHGDK